MAIYITGDLHGTMDARKRLFDKLTEKDILIVLGDFGFSWNPKTEQQWNSYNFPFTTISVLGNHENYDRIYKDYPLTTIFGGQVYQLNDRTFYCKNGEAYHINGKDFFCFGGANSIDKEYRLPRLSWWPEEIPSMQEYNHALDTLQAHNYTFDYIITHAGSESEEIDMLHYPYRIKDNVCIMLENMFNLIIDNNGSYKHHFYGHHHVYGHNDKATVMYQQVYCLDNDETKFY